MFEFIDMIIVRPIVNLLFVIYNFVGDFGLAIIIFTILVKFLMWPIVKKQLHQTRLMRKTQPELAEIKKNCKGNRQLESLQMMDLYKRNNIKPFRSILTLLIQLPIMVALYTAIRVVVTPPIKDYDTVGRYSYSFVSELPKISTIIGEQNTIKSIILDNSSKAEENKQIEKDNEGKSEEEKAPIKELAEVPRLETKLFGIVDLSQGAGFTTISSATIMVFAIVCAFGQYWMTRQQNPSNKKRRTFKQIMKDAAEGKEADQAELNAMVSGQMTKFMPIMMFFIMVSLPGALVFYYMMSNLITVAQQKIILNRSYDEMEQSAEKAVLKELRNIEEAQIVTGGKNKKVNITRIKAGNKRSKK